MKKILLSRWKMNGSFTISSANLPVDTNSWKKKPRGVQINRPHPHFGPLSEMSSDHKIY